MSSLRVRAQNKLLNTLGAAKPSKNVQFDFAITGFESTNNGILELEGALRGFIMCLKSFHVAGQTLVRVIENVGGNPENSAETKQFANEIKSSFVQLDGHLLNENVARYEQRVLNPTIGWLSRAHTLRQQIAAFNEEKLLYDHYTRKVMALREARDKRAAAGKAEKAKDVEKLVRNEQKYAAITSSYSKLSDQTIANLREFTSTREDTLTPILYRMLEFRVKYAKQVFEESQKIQPLIQNGSKYDAIMGQLDSFVARLTGGNGASTTTASGGDNQATTAAREPDVPVQSFSFASFVGEAPPTIPPDKTTSAESSKTSDKRASFSSGSGFTRPPPLASPSSPDGFYFDDFAQSAPTSPMANGSFHQQLTPPPPPSSSAPLSFPSSPASYSTMPSSPSASSWDDMSAFPTKPSAPPLSASSFNTVPTSPSSASAWGAFDDLTPPAALDLASPSSSSAANAPADTGMNPFQADFAKLHQNALGGGSPGAFSF